MTEGRRCTICRNATLRATIDRGLEIGLSNAGISRQLAEFGAAVEPTVIGRHKTHWVKLKPPEMQHTKRDAAIIIKEKLLNAIEDREAGPDGLNILDKDLQPALTTALKAQGLQDSREKAKAKTGTAELAFAIIRMLGGQAPVAALDDGLTIEGDFEEVDGPAE